MADVNGPQALAALSAVLGRNTACRRGKTEPVPPSTPLALPPHRDRRDPPRQQFQNIVLPPRSASGRKERVRSWLEENAAGERKSGDTNEQFYYKARKKAIGPFKRDFWSLPEEARSAIAADLEQMFAFLFEQLNVNGTQEQVNRFIQAPMQHHAALKPVLVAAADDPDAGE